MRLVQGGTFTPLLWELPVGQRMRMIGPKGKFMLGADDDRTHVFISSGTGNAPFVSMMRELLIHGRPRNGRVLQRGLVRARARLPAAPRGLGARPARIPCATSRPSRARTTRANAGWTGRTGRVESILGAASSTSWACRRPNSVAYICGNPDMILSAEETLLGRGYPEDQVHKELYWPKGKEPRGVTGADLAAAIDAAEANADE